MGEIGRNRVKIGRNREKLSKDWEKLSGKMIVWRN